MKKKKTVTLPRIYKPGPGHPAETLAYLNPMEHELIRQLTDGTFRRGPRGVKSYAVETGTTTTTNSGGGAGKGQGGQGGPGGGALSAPNRTAPSSTSSGVIGSKGGGASTQKSGTTETGVVDTKTVAKAAETLKQSRTTAMSGVVSAAQANAGNYPSKGSYTASPSYGRDLGSVFNTEMRDIGKPNDYLDNSRMSFDKWATGAVGNLYSRSPNNVSEMARTIAGEAANQTPEQRAAVANVMNNRLSLGRSYMGGPTVPGMLRGFDANGYDAARVGGANSAYSNAVPGTENYTNGLKALSDAMNPASSFMQTAPAGVMNATHYYNPADASPSWAKTPNFQSTQTAFGDHVFGNPENTVRDVVAARGLPGGTQVAGIANAGLGQAATLQRAQKAAEAAAAMQRLGPVQGPNQPLSAIPAPSSMGMMPPRGTAGTFTDPYNPPMQGPVRYGASSAIPSPNSIGMMAPTIGPVNDPRVGLPAGSFPTKTSFYDNERTVAPGHWGREEVNYLTNTGTMDRISRDPNAQIGYEKMQNPDGSGLRQGPQESPFALGSFPIEKNYITMRTGQAPEDYAKIMTHELGHVGEYSKNPDVFRTDLGAEEYRQHLVDASLDKPGTTQQQASLEKADMYRINRNANRPDLTPLAPVSGLNPRPTFSSVLNKGALSPLSTLPAAKPKDIQLAYNLPPMGGAIPSAYGDLFSTWGTNRPLPTGPAATPGTIHSKTADATTAPPAANTSGWSWGDLYNTASTKVGEVKKQMDAAKETPAFKFAQNHPRLAEFALKMMMGGGGNPNSPMGNPQDRSNQYIKPMAPQQQMQQTAQAVASQDPVQILTDLQQNMIAKGASEEELAYVQSLIDQLTQQVA